MKKGRKRTAALLVSLMLLSAFLPAGVMQVRAAEVIATERFCPERRKNC